ncbi:MAG: hypothetical protein WB869_07300 [Candidatus Acidiferrales bacterium]
MTARLRIRMPARFLAAFLCFAALLISAAAKSTPAQTISVERSYAHPVDEVQRALQELDVDATNRLPFLDGFVGASANSLDRLENPRYVLRSDVVRVGPTETIVRISAKVTAWYQSADASRSEYRAIPSNGRLESDFLDRLRARLDPASSTPAETNADTPPAVDQPAQMPATSSEPRPAISTHTSADAGATHAAGANPSNNRSDLATEIEALRAQRKALQDTASDLNVQIEKLQVAARERTNQSGLATIRRGHTPVFDKADETSRILLHASAQDEFSVIDVRGGSDGAAGVWVHVQLENGKQGWVRAGQLQTAADAAEADAVMPGQSTASSADPGPDRTVNQTGNQTGARTSNASAAHFVPASEEIKTFSGDWAALKGKPVLFVFAQPNGPLSDDALVRSQLAFAKQTFETGLNEAVHSQESLAGVVAVFLGPKGGVAAATLPDIRRWRDGIISDKMFLSRCSLDPATSFRDATHPSLSVNR